MRETRPTCDPAAVFCVKRTAAELEISVRCLCNYRHKGLITPIDPKNIRRLLYTGQSVIDCWDKYTKQKLDSND